LWLKKFDQFALQSLTQVKIIYSFANYYIILLNIAVCLYGNAKFADKCGGVCLFVPNTLKPPGIKQMLSLLLPKSIKKYFVSHLMYWYLAKPISASCKFNLLLKALDATESIT